ncbi:MAG TPA: dihydrodipicolinate synthase family protein [Draconibacterium sp.]|nr:dihydrodipicolinate synthase family protein [Draconibacterium sp.]HRX11597.1 dihydrodipicolinate synthase family protein [Draconibacterium sp.]
MKSPLTGIIPPVVTPLLSNTELDVKGLKNLIDHLLNGGVHGIFLLGTTGEATNLEYKLRKEFINLACKFVDKKVPVVVGITDTCLQGSLEIAEVAKSAGADAVVVSSPYYLPMSQSEFVYYLEQLTPQLPLPFLMYNMPSCTKMHMSLATVRRAKELGAIGIKDSSGNLPYLLSMIEEFKDSPEFAIIAGTEMFLPETIMNGGHGAVAGGANIFPSLFVELYEASVNADLEKIELLRSKLVEIEEKIYNVGSYASKYIKTIKSSLSAMGICNDFVAMPFQQFNEVKSNRIKQNLKEMNILEPVQSNILKT